MENEQSLSAEGRQRRRLFTHWVARVKQPLNTEGKDVPPIVARPPQALPEPLFSAACNGCGDCLNVCPYGLLTLENDKATLNVEFTECDHCTQCTSACRTGALRTHMPCDTTLRPQISASCLGRQDSCRICIISCPQQALSLGQTAQGDRQLQCNELQCNGCGLCKLSCFHGHISLAATGERALPARL
ncbi:4Fe-4S dicluster domain-containing protein [Serratia sp. NPDC078593]|uniref:4Fe-4S dicluster domain-containing protein n=1 Tax=unclassified Serratia (in: enterobacteria) TaxID=2647522 RepID=UPI0037CFAE02